MMKKSILILIYLFCLCLYGCGHSRGESLESETIHLNISQKVESVSIWSHGNSISVLDETVIKDLTESVSGLSFVKVNDKEIKVPGAVYMQISFDTEENEMIRFTLPVWENENGVYYCENASSTISKFESVLSGQYDVINGYIQALSSGVYQGGQYSIDVHDFIIEQFGPHAWDDVSYEVNDYTGVVSLYFNGMSKSENGYWNFHFIIAKCTSPDDGWYIANDLTWIEP